jgi:hypothetical protein
MNEPEIKPPVYEKKVGRPTKSRRKQPFEVQGENGPKLSKHGVQITCSWCKGPDHNSKGCKLRKDGITSLEAKKWWQLKHFSNLSHQLIISKLTLLISSTRYMHCLMH